jgi:transposase InsO family protein
MNDSRIVSIAQIKEFIKVAKGIEFKGASRKEKYAWIEEVLLRFRYFSLQKKEKSILKGYMMKMTGFSDAQLTRLIAKKKKIGKILADTTRRHRFQKKYTPEDVARLIETDKAHDRLSGPATKRIFQRMYEIFQDQRFQRLKDISVAHIYNLRGTRQYISWTKFFTKTRPTPVNIGERRKPNPQGQPGFLRVDTVHQGDLDKEKGVYHINLVDEVTQWEIVGACEKISEQYLQPILEAALEQFPFRIKGFHSDNGSEYINQIVAKLLNKLLVEQTKSRSRHCNDNALVEGKNGSVIRKHLGYWHIPQRYAATLNKFYRTYFNPYLNYHRPCGFATLKISEKGKVKKVYDVYRTPFEALTSHPRASEFLKEGVTIEKLKEIAKEKSDNECAAQMQKAKDELFKNLSRHKLQLPTTYAYHFGLIS